MKEFYYVHYTNENFKDQKFFTHPIALQKLGLYIIQLKASTIKKKDKK